MHDLFKSTLFNNPQETKQMVESLDKIPDEDRCINSSVFQEFILEARLVNTSTAQSFTGTNEENELHTDSNFSQ